MLKRLLYFVSVASSVSIKTFYTDHCIYHELVKEVFLSVCNVKIVTH